MTRRRADAPLPGAPGAGRPARFRVVGATLALALGAAAGDAQALNAGEQALVDRARQFSPIGNPRRLELERADNFRDLGGYPDAAGTRRIRSGLLYRSARLSKITARDRERLQALGVRSVADFRDERERKRRPLKLPDGVEVAEYPAPGLTEKELRRAVKESSRRSPFDGARFMEALYRRMVREAAPAYGEWLHSLRRDGAAPQVFQGVGGKDRIGLAAALLLRALGIPWDIVQGDYLLSAVYDWRGKEKRVRQIRFFAALRSDLSAENVLPVITVQRSFLQAAFDEIDENYGGFENYLRRNLKISAQEQRELQRRYLEPIPQQTATTDDADDARSSGQNAAE